MYALTIKNKSYVCGSKIIIKDHIYNNAGSQCILQNVFPANEKDWTKSFDIPAFSYAILTDVATGKVIFWGYVKKQSVNSLDKNKPKGKRIVLVTAKEFLTTTPMDFIIYDQTPAEVVNKIVLDKMSGTGKFNVGNLSFDSPDEKMEPYNTRNMSAYDVLRYIEKQTHSMLIISNDLQNKVLNVNFYTYKDFKDKEDNKWHLDLLNEQEKNDEYQVEDIT